MEPISPCERNTSPYPELRIKTPPPDSDHEIITPRVRRRVPDRNRCGRISVAAIALFGLLGLLSETTGDSLTTSDIGLIVIMSLIVYCVAVISVAMEAPTTQFESEV